MRAALLATAMAVPALGFEGIGSVPLFLWSQQPYFLSDGSNHVRSGAVLTQAQFSRTIDQLLQPDSVAEQMPFLAPQQTAPEVVLAFVHSKLSSSDASRFSGAYGASTKATAGFSFLQGALKESQSSSEFPYFVSTQADEGALSLSEQLISSVSKANSNAQTIAFQLGAENPENFEGDNVAGCDALLSHIQEEGSQTFSNGLTDLILVKANNPADMTDACLQRVTKYIAQETKDQALCLLSADASSVPVQLTFDPEPQALFQMNAPSLKQAGLGAATEVYVGPEYITAPIVTGLAVVFIMLFILMCGVSCLMSIEAPVRFGDKMLQIGKEY